MQTKYDLSSVGISYFLVSIASECAVCWSLFFFCPLAWCKWPPLPSCLFLAGQKVVVLLPFGWILNEISYRLWLDWNIPSCGWYRTKFKRYMLIWSLVQVYLIRDMRISAPSELGHAFRAQGVQHQDSGDRLGVVQAEQSKLETSSSYFHFLWGFALI